MNRLDVTWRHTLLIWWSYIWRCFLFSLILSLLAGALAGLMLGVMGKPELGTTVGGFLGYVISLPVSIVMMKQILNKQFKGFSIAVVANDPPEKIGAFSSDTGDEF